MMGKGQKILFRVLGTAHIAVSIILLPGNLFLSVFSLPFVLPLQIWLIILGARLWRTNCQCFKALRRTHLALIPFSILLLLFGVGALEGAKRSAEAGGGLLGSFGLIPITMGVFTGILSVSTLVILYFIKLEKTEKSDEWIFCQEDYDKDI